MNGPGGSFPLSLGLDDSDVFVEGLSNRCGGSFRLSVEVRVELGQRLRGLTCRNGPRVFRESRGEIAEVFGGRRIPSGSFAQRPPEKPLRCFAIGFQQSLDDRQYLLGFDLQKRDFEDYGQPSYLRGEWRGHGWWYYYLDGCLVKIPHGTQLLFVLAVALTMYQAILKASGRRQPAEFSQYFWRDELILLAPAVTLF
ncbi:MAG: hypothetical protein H0T47_11035, partial [Planctomycetaceae bacterium]|nr:hypothetical protein [Planctomycetaceae bacterium]